MVRFTDYLVTPIDEGFEIRRYDGDVDKKDSYTFTGVVGLNNYTTIEGALDAIKELSKIRSKRYSQLDKLAKFTEGANVSVLDPKRKVRCRTTATGRVGIRRWYFENNFDTVVELAEKRGAWGENGWTFDGSSLHSAYLVRVLKRSK